MKRELILLDGLLWRSHHTKHFLTTAFIFYEGEAAVLVAVLWDGLSLLSRGVLWVCVWISLWHSQRFPKWQVAELGDGDTH